MTRVRSCVDLLSQNAQIILPMVGGVIMQSSQEQRIGKLIKGICLVSCGIGIVAASGVPKALKERIWNRESRVITKLEMGTACFGVFLIARGILEASSLNFSDIHTSEDRLDELKKNFLSCPEAKKLWNEVKSDGPFAVKFVSVTELSTGAKVNFLNREISLSDTKPETMMGSLTFELINLKNYREIPPELCAMSADDYAFSVESFEYETLKEKTQVLQRCVDSNFWPKSMQPSSLPNIAEDSATQEKFGHTDQIRLRWYVSCSPNDLSEWVAKKMPLWEETINELLKKAEEGSYELVESLQEPFNCLNNLRIRANKAVLFHLQKRLSELKASNKNLIP